MTTHPATWPPPGYVATDEAARLIGRSRQHVQSLCRRYWQRIDAERAKHRVPDLRQLDPIRGERRRELRCLREGYGRRASYAIDPVDLDALVRTLIPTKRWPKRSTSEAGAESSEWHRQPHSQG